MDVQAQFPTKPLPFAELIGIEIVSASPECVIAEIVVREDLCTLQGAMHGGVLMAFADTLGALGTVANLKDGAGTVTVESKTNFIRAAPVGSRVRGEAVPLHRGQRTMVWQTRLTLPDGKLVAHVTQTQLVL